MMPIQVRVPLLPVILLAATTSAFAATVSVGNCRPSLQKFSTISQAVSSVAAGSTILVCPGVYREQITISQPLTLTGVQDLNAANPRIAVTLGGLTQSVNSQINGIPIFFQILVKDTESGAVNISNIAVDGTNSRVPDSVVGLAGIYYQNSSGTISKVAVYRHYAKRAGYGILLDNVTTPPKKITVANSSVHAFDAEGIRTNVQQPSLTVDIRSNSVISSDALNSTPSAGGIDVDAIGTISGNRVVSRPESSGISAGVGIAFRSNTFVSNNTVVGFSVGIWPVGDSNTIKSNMVLLTSGAIVLSGQNNIVQYNSILDVIHGGAAITFNCTGTSNTVTHNIINDANIGIIDHPGNVVAPNSYSNVNGILSPPC